jgi:hypothetical protein
MKDRTVRTATMRVASSLASAALALFVLAGGLAGPPNASAQTLQVSLPFRALVAKETAKKLKLEAVREVEVPTGKYLAAIFRYPEEDADKPDYQGLRLYFAPTGAMMAEERASYDEQRVALGTYDDESAAVVDVNCDKTPDLVATAANGGNCWTCSRVLIYSLGASEARLLASAPLQIENVYGDETPELLVGDTRWEFYGELSHAGSPHGTLVYAWRDGRYVFAGAEAAAFYEKAAAALRTEVAEGAKIITADDPYSDDAYLGAAISLYLVSTYVGQGGSGLETLKANLGAHAPNAAMRERRAKVLQDFTSGESSKRVESPKAGDALEPIEGPSLDEPKMDESGAGGA